MVLNNQHLLFSAITFSISAIVIINQQYLEQIITSRQPPPYPNVIATYVNKLENWSPVDKFAAGIGVPTYAIDHSYNVVILSFWLSQGIYAAALAFQEPTQYIGQNTVLGQTDKDVQQAIINLYHSKNISLLISAFGASQEPTTEGKDPIQTCTNIAQYVIDNNFDGVDLDYEDSPALFVGTGEDWLIKCTKTLRVYLPKRKYIITHAPQAPYFIGTQLYKNGGYLKVNQEVGDLIDWYNIQFYNQETTTYDTYESLFTKSNGFLTDTSVSEIIAKGIPKEKIVVGKPVANTDVYNTGIVSPRDFGLWAKKAYEDFGWNGGIFTWQYSSDLNGAYVNTFLNNLQNKANLRRN